MSIRDHVRDGRIVGYPGAAGPETDIDLSGLDMVSLEGCPKAVSGRFSCAGNPRLKSLKGCPDRASVFMCDRSGVESLREGPSRVETHFYCSLCPGLRTLHGLPKTGTLHSVGNPDLRFMGANLGGIVLETDAQNLLAAVASGCGRVIDAADQETLEFIGAGSTVFRAKLAMVGLGLASRAAL